LVSVAVAALPVAPDDWRLRHKTTDRGFYDAARQEGGAFEMVFTRFDGQLTEGSFSGIFVLRGGVLLTLPASHGLLSGILRPAAWRPAGGRGLPVYC
jgi:para-aminobenzoate synthetase/4-amino-4-deoxychorismate lyase